MRPRYKVPENAKAARGASSGRPGVFGARLRAIEAQEDKDAARGAYGEPINHYGEGGAKTAPEQADWESLLEESDYVAVMGAISRRGLPIVQLWLKEYATTKKEPTK